MISKYIKNRSTVEYLKLKNKTNLETISLKPKHMQVLNSTGPGVRQSKRPLSACRIL